MSKSNVTFNCVGYVDRRSAKLNGHYAAMLQARADDALEREWRRRVAANRIERQRIACERAAGILSDTTGLSK